MTRGLVFNDADPETMLVIRSVLPVFTRERERPERIGTCVLVRIDDHSFVITAAHVLYDIRQCKGRFTAAIGGQLVAFQIAGFGTHPNDPMDIGLIPMKPETAAAIERDGGVFLESSQIDETEKASGIDLQNALANTYLAVGFPASRSQSRIQHREKKIHVKTYSIRLTLAPTADYPDGLSGDTHLLLDYAADQIRLRGKAVIPPTVKGMSGGGVFRFRRRLPETIRLIGILIEHHRNIRVMVATRIAVVAELAREIIARQPEAFR